MADKSTEVLLEIVQRLEKDADVRNGELSVLQREKENLLTKLRYAQEVTVEKMIGIALILVVLTGCVLGYLRITRNTGVPEFCYVETVTLKIMHEDTRVGSQDQFGLFASLPWESDRKLGLFPTLDEAITASSKLGCPLR